MPTKALLNIVPTLHAAKLVDAAMKDSKKKPSVENTLHSATRTLVGTSLIQIESGLIAGL